jgi:Xaa-Pro aminopeptidase
MPAPALIAAHREVQSAAKAVLSELAHDITPADTERSIAEKTVARLRRHGITETWYYNCPALVLLGSRSSLSVSGRDYEPGNEPVGELNVVSVDVSPSLKGHWGDCARSFLIENGRVTDRPVSAELSRGRRVLNELHAGMKSFMSSRTSFHELFCWANEQIAAAGFENLDFRGNVGHSIVTRREDRQYIEAGNHSKVSEVPFFTFEPHVREAGGNWGFKHEDIYFFGTDGQPEVL